MELVKLLVSFLRLAGQRARRMPRWAPELGASLSRRKGLRPPSRATTRIESGLGASFGAHSRQRCFLLWVFSALLVLSDASSFFCLSARFMLLGSFFTWVYFLLEPFLFFLRNKRAKKTTTGGLQTRVHSIIVYVYTVVNPPPDNSGHMQISIIGRSMYKLWKTHPLIAQGKSYK
jgi:hypothetical protein